MASKMISPCRTQLISVLPTIQNSKCWKPDFDGYKEIVTCSHAQCWPPARMWVVSTGALRLLGGTSFTSKWFKIFLPITKLGTKWLLTKWFGIYPCLWRQRSSCKIRTVMIQFFTRGSFRPAVFTCVLGMVPFQPSSFPALPCSPHCHCCAVFPAEKWSVL
jgi:hypothetical protein